MWRELYEYKQKQIFQGRGRPQGNGDKTDLRLFPKKLIKQLFWENSKFWKESLTFTNTLEIVAKR